MVRRRNSPPCMARKVPATLTRSHVPKKTLALCPKNKTGVQKIKLVFDALIMPEVEHKELSRIHSKLELESEGIALMWQFARSAGLAFSIVGSVICAGVGPAAADLVCVAGTPGPGSNLGSNPNGAQFCNVATASFADDYFFKLTTLSDFTLNVTASNSSVPQISNWKMAVFLDADGVPGVGDILINPPGTVSASGNPQTISLSVTGLAANTGAGQYYVHVTGDASAGPSIYNGNVTTFGVPGPIAGAGLPGLLAACGGLVMLARRRRKSIAP